MQITLNAAYLHNLIGQECGHTIHPITNSREKYWTPQKYTHHLVIHFRIEVVREAYLTRYHFLFKNIKDHQANQGNWKECRDSGTIHEASQYKV